MQTKHTKRNFQKEVKYNLVDFDDNFICIGTKKDAKKLKLFTRSVHILLTNKDNKIMVCKRPPNKKNYPNQITSSAGGHVEKGEKYAVAAKRELKEELNIVTPLRDLGRFNVVTNRERTIHHLFLGKSKKVLPDINEISDYYFLSLKEIIKDIKLHPRKYCKPFHEAIKCYLNYIK